jgi:hypothetical protein
MEYVLVHYWRKRTVFVDGEANGTTNAIIALGEEGYHRFDLGSPPNYCPSSQRKLVSGTTRQFPLEIEFLHESQ